MKKRIIAVILSTSVLAAVVVVILFPRGRKPQFNGASARPAIESVAIESVAETNEPSLPLSNLPLSNLPSSNRIELVKTDSPKLEDAKWNRFRGPNGTGVSVDSTIPTEWSDSKNLQWKTKLPGSGASSPVVTAKHVFLTSYSGYGEDGQQGDMKQLKRHLSCIDRSNGEIVWTRTIDNEQREDPYQCGIRRS